MSSNKRAEKKDSDDAEIPGMKLDQKYSSKKPLIPENTEEVQKEMDKTKKELDKLKGSIIKKYPFTIFLSILHPQSIKFFIEEEEIPKETEKYIQLYWLVPEDQFKNISKLKAEAVKMIEDLQGKFGQKVWIQVKTPVDIWEMGLDSKFELMQGVAMSLPLHDKGFLQGLRLTEIHKSLVLQKFEKYVVSYVLGGSFVRGDTIKTSDIDVFVIINDTDVKRMPRVELRERLRGIIVGEHVQQACSFAGVKNSILNIQVYLLTDFWESVKDAHPVIFTFIRDGVPLYDRGTFMPWKTLLKMGKLKPSPEAIDMFMSMGDNTVKRAKRALLDILLQDIYWSVITPSQALIMLYGLPPPNTKETYTQMKKIFVDKEKMLEKKYIDILEEITIKYYKGYEHEKIKEVSGAQIDKLLKGTEDYLKRLKELREQIEKQSLQKTIEQVHKDVFGLLEAVTEKKSQVQIIQEFEKLIKRGKFTQQHLRILNEVVSAKAESKKGKLNFQKSDTARRNAMILINDLIEFSQRKDLAVFEKGKMRIKFGEKDYADLAAVNGQVFLVKEGVVHKVTNKLENSSQEEFSKAMDEQKSKKSVEINPEVFAVLKKEFGRFDIIL
ncbi:MAG: nucleotidyltransferase domain-containing protein [Nanoarchaeota archaeon]